LKLWITNISFLKILYFVSACVDTFATTTGHKLTASTPASSVKTQEGCKAMCAADVLCTGAHFRLDTKACDFTRVATKTIKMGGYVYFEIEYRCPGMCNVFTAAHIIRGRQ